MGEEVLDRQNLGADGEHLPQFAGRIAGSSRIRHRRPAAAA